jgi:hypothetical protein
MIVVLPIGLALFVCVVRCKESNYWNQNDKENRNACSRAVVRTLSLDCHHSEKENLKYYTVVLHMCVQHLILFCALGSSLY